MFSVHRDWLRERPADYGGLTLPRLLLGAAISSEDYLNAMRVRRQLAADVERVFEHVDVLLTAVTLDVAPPFKPTPHFRFWPVQTYAFNVTGHPAISEIGRASCRERVCQYVSISVVAVSLKKKDIRTETTTRT